MRAAQVFRNKQLVGTLTEYDQGNYVFEYDENWFQSEAMPAVSLTLPKSQRIYHAGFLFPFFFNMLSEGVNRKLQCRLLKIDEHDHFGLLLATASTDSVGAITFKPVSQKNN